MITERNNCAADWDLTIVNRNTLSSDMDWMTKERIRAECNCVNKQICILFVEKLDKGKREEVEDGIHDLK